MTHVIDWSVKWAPLPKSNGRWSARDAATSPSGNEETTDPGSPTERPGGRLQVDHVGILIWDPNLGCPQFQIIILFSMKMVNFGVHRILNHTHLLIQWCSLFDRWSRVLAFHFFKLHGRWGLSWWLQVGSTGAEKAKQAALSVKLCRLWPRTNATGPYVFASTGNSKEYFHRDCLAICSTGFSFPLPNPWKEIQINLWKRLQ